jgi:uncharacterized protein YjbI with pentapeptide repeats
MDTATIGELRILTPDIDPRDLDPVVEPPDYGLTDALAENADWRGLDLADIRLVRSRLVGVDLSDSTWRGVTVNGCELERVDLSSARLENVTFERCRFTGCRLTGVHLTDATLKNVIFDDCRLDYATLHSTRTTGPAGWRRCNLTNAALVACRLPAVAITGCRLTGLELDDCDLRGADLRGNELTDLHGLISLRGAILDRGQLPDLATIAAQDLALDVRDT